MSLNDDASKRHCYFLTTLKITQKQKFDTIKYAAHYCYLCYPIDTIWNTRCALDYLILRRLHTPKGCEFQPSYAATVLHNCIVVLNALSGLPLKDSLWGRRMDYHATIKGYKRYFQKQRAVNSWRNKRLPLHERRILNQWSAQRKLQPVECWFQLGQHKYVEEFNYRRKVWSTFYNVGTWYEGFMRGQDGCTGLPKSEIENYLVQDCPMVCGDFLDPVTGRPDIITSASTGRPVLRGFLGRYKSKACNSNNVVYLPCHIGTYRGYRCPWRGRIYVWDCGSITGFKQYMIDHPNRPFFPDHLDPTLPLNASDSRDNIHETFKLSMGQDAFRVGNHSPRIGRTGDVGRWLGRSDAPMTHSGQCALRWSHIAASWNENTICILGRCGSSKQLIRPWKEAKNFRTCGYSRPHLVPDEYDLADMISLCADLLETTCGYWNTMCGVLF